MSKNRYFDPTKNHHTVNGFKNSEPFTIKSRDIKKWRKERNVLPPKVGYQSFAKTWSCKIDLSLVGDRVWWIGHATTLIRLNNKMILTDPVFSERASPSQLIGPKRRTPPALMIDDLPQIDIILISHNHYDHLDFNSMRQLIDRFPSVVIMVPLGLKQKLLQWCAKQVIELDWWDRMIVNGISISATPARHWGRRGVFDTNKTLWCGWMMQADQKSIYFMGDTGYSPKLKEIGERFPAIDLALIPIGAYAPRWFMQSQHIDPKQAVQLFDELHCKSAMAIHWGAFELADDPLDEPPELLKELRAERTFHILKIGESLPIDK